LAQLRDIVPIRPLTRIEAVAVAERQALLLLKLAGIRQPPVPERLVEDLLGIELLRIPLLGNSGMSTWERGRWRVAVNSNHSRLRQRFTAWHEVKHVVDRPFERQLYGAIDPIGRSDWIESVCDTFAACVLVPRLWLKHAWAGGLQDVRQLAHRFDVSQAAMQTRLVRTGLAPSPPRCSYETNWPSLNLGGDSSRHAA
jgi:Zn-dependent peptidase ImmA (M78 family)